MTLDLNALKQAAAETGVDHAAKAAGGGGKREVLAAGRCMLRFTGFVELGKQPETYQGKPAPKVKAMLTFEVFGPKYPITEYDGEKRPNLLTFEVSLTQTDKSLWPRVFALLNYKGTAKHAADLLGEAYSGTIYHKKYKRKTDPADEASWTGIDVSLRDPKSGSFSIGAPIVEDPETGEARTMNVPQPVGPIRAFLFNSPSMNQWASLFIDGEFPEVKNEDGSVKYPARSRNFIQQKVAKALNFVGSPMHELLLTNGVSLDLGIDDTDEEEEAAAPAPAPAPKPPAAKKLSFDEMDDDIPF